MSLINVNAISRDHEDKIVSRLLNPLLFFPSEAPPVGAGMLVVVAVGGVELETANPSIPGRCVYQYNPGQQVHTLLCPTYNAFGYKVIC